MKKLSFLILTMLLPLLASAESSGVSYRYDTETKTAYVAYRSNSGTGSNYYGDIVIPEEILHEGETYTVTGIDDNAFTFCSNLTSIVLPSTLKRIGKYGFAGCSSLTSITLPEGLTTIVNWAFSDCTGLTSITIPSTVTSLGEDVFRRCSSLASVTVKAPVVGKYAFSDLPSIKELILGEGVTSIGDYAFKNCTGITSVTIPEGVTTIGQNAFEGCTGLTAITLSEGLTSIRMDAFSGCNSLTTLTIPSTVTTVGAGAWWKCSSLTDVYCLPTEVPFTSTYKSESYPQVILHVPAESADSYKNRDICKTYKEIVASTSTNIQFADEAVKVACVKNWDTDDDSELSFAEAMAVTDMESAFSQEKAITNFDEIRFFRNLMTIGKETFLNCSGLTAITIPKSVTAIDGSAFAGCSALTAIKVADGNTVYDSRNNCNAIITTADNMLVAGCKNTVIPADVTAIGEYAFSGCSNLTMVKLPNTISSIGAYAFNGCSKLKIVYCFAEEVPETGSNVFDGMPIDAATLYVPNADSYKAATPWKDFKAFVDLTSPIQFADANTKSLCVGKWDTDADGELSFGEAAAVKDIGSVFKSTSITTFDELQYFTGLTAIGSSAFNGSRLTSVIIPEGVTSIGLLAFSGGNPLSSVTIPSTMISIVDMAFYYCEKLKKVYSYAETPPSANGAFTNASIGTATLYVPEGSIEAYKAVEPWNQFGDIAAIGSEAQPIIIEPIDEETTVSPSDEAEPGKVVVTDEGVAISLGDNDVVDKKNGFVKVTTAMTPDEVKDLLKQQTPEEPDFYEQFKGIYSQQSAGRGYIKIECETMGNFQLTVMQGTEKVSSYTQATKGFIKIKYDFVNDEWVFIFPTVTAAARAKMGREPAEDGLKIYSITFVPSDIQAGDANNDGTVDAKDIVEVVKYIMGTPSDAFEEDGGDANEDGEVNAADIVTIVNEIMKAE